MSALIDLKGKTFGRLTVIDRAPNAARGMACWKCVCICGNTRIVRGADLTRGKTVSCRCFAADQAGKLNLIHGYSKRSPEYLIWKAMRSRCNYPRNKHYGDYGGRGIRVCDRWNNFENFLEDMGPRPSLKHSIDRIDTDGNYEPENCRWASLIEQANNRRNNRLIEWNGKTYTLSNLIRESKTSLRLLTVRNRLVSGWSVNDALFTPSQVTQKAVVQ